MKTLETSQVEGSKNKRNHILFHILLICILIAIVVFLYWFFIGRFHESTEDAYVNGNMVQLNPQISGTITSFFTDDTDFIEEGQVVALIDPTDFQLRYERRQSDLALAVRDVRQLWENVQQQRARLSSQEASQAKAKFDYNNRLGLIPTQAVSKEDLDHSHIALDIAEAQVNEAKHQLEATLAAFGNTPVEHHPKIENAKAMLRDAFIQLKRCTLLAPATGYVAKRSVQVGEWVTPSRTLLNIIPLNQVWIDANFKETELKNIRINQPAKVKVDLYGSQTFEGKVIGIAAGSGSVFSLLPPQNATGNWIKLVQRIPVRILLDQDQIRKYPLRLGLSVYVNVETTERGGHVLAQIPSKKEIASTSVYSIHMQDVENLIDKIVQENIKPKIQQ